MPLDFQLPAISDEDVTAIDGWWRAANYLNIGQIYLQANPLLREPLVPDHIKPRLLGHWGTSPGLNLIYAHMNRLICKYDLDAIYLAGPGHGGPAILANVWLEGSYTAHYPEVTQDEAGMLRLFRQFSTPGGVPSHVSVPTPGSIHEGGELGYVLVHAQGAVMDNPTLLAIAVVGDGEAETGPLAGSWKGIDFLNPARDGAVLPILHLNGYKISGPTVFGRTSDENLRMFFAGQGYDPLFVEGDDPQIVHRAFGAVLESAVLRIADIQRRARQGENNDKPLWPLIVLRTPKGWTGPKIVDGKPVEGTFRAHQVPVDDVRDNSGHLAILESWMKSYRPEELFENGRLRGAYTRFTPQGERRMGCNPHANGGSLTVPLTLPDIAAHQIKFEKRAAEPQSSTKVLGTYLRDIYRANPDNFRLFCPDETNSNKLGAVFEVSDRCLMDATIAIDDHVSHQGRVMEVLSEHCCHGWLEGYNLTGRHGLFASYEAFAVIIDSMAMQHAKWIEHSEDVPWRKPIPSLNYLLTSTCWRNDHNGFSHQGPGFIDNILHRKATVARIYFPPDANCLLSVAHHCFGTKNYLNLIVIDKQPQLQWLGFDEAVAHCAKGAGIWDFFSNTGDAEPDIVLACAGDIPTLETVAAAWLLRRHAPGIKVRVVNVVDLMRLCTPQRHPHGMSDEDFIALFTASKPVVFAFHGYPGVIHEVIHGRVETERFHVRGYVEEGTTTTPFDMVVLNGMSRLHLCLDVARYVTKVLQDCPAIVAYCNDMLAKHEAYTRAHFDDLPEIKNWAWSD